MARAPATGSHQNGSASKAKTKEALKPGELSKAQRKKAAKKAKKAAHASWCWYCDREFEDDKILLAHQKAKHFRCPHCPRRLNTAGGLAVHIDQVHKVPVDKLENTLPGRDSFDIEIYGMEGIPKDDLAAWRRKRDEELGLSNKTQSKRPKVYKGVISLDDLAKQLAHHRTLMRNSENGGPGLRVAGAPVPMLPPGMPALPGGIPLPPPGMFPLPPNMMPIPPPGFASPAMPGGIPGIPMAAPAPAAPKAYVAPSSRVELKAGSVLVYGDNDVSVEEKRAKNPKYAANVQPPQPSSAPQMSGANVPPPQPANSMPAGDTASSSAGTKRARATDFI